jgi:hypothetical protein
MFQLVKEILGDVYKAKLQHSNQEVAVKRCFSKSVGDVSKLMKEAEILAQYDYSSIVKLIGVNARTRLSHIP